MIHSTRAQSHDACAVSSTAICDWTRRKKKKKKTKANLYLERFLRKARVIRPRGLPVYKPARHFQRSFFKTKMAAFGDLCIVHQNDSRETENLISKAVKLGYETIAVSSTFLLTNTKKTKLKASCPAPIKLEWNTNSDKIEGKEQQGDNSFSFDSSSRRKQPNAPAGHRCSSFLWYLSCTADDW